MLKQRVVTAVLLLAIILPAIIWLPHPAFLLLVGLVFLLGGWEWANLSELKAAWQKLLYLLLLLIAMWGLTRYTNLWQPVLLDVDAYQSVLGLACLWWAVALLWVMGYPQSALLWGSSWARAAMGLLVLLPSWMALVSLRGQEQGLYWFFYLVLLTIAADVGAYFAGMRFGRHKLAPKVSPGKSWEGVLGGLASVAVLAALAAYFSALPLAQVMAVSLFTALASVLGDLLESMVKRERGVKDSSQLLPGHGGVLDRLDGFTAAAPVFALLTLLLSTQ